MYPHFKPGSIEGTDCHPSYPGPLPPSQVKGFKGSRPAFPWDNLGIASLAPARYRGYIRAHCDTMMGQQGLRRSCPACARENRAREFVKFWDTW